MTLLVLARQHLIIRDLLRSQKNLTDQFTNEVSSLRTRSDAQDELATKLGDEVTSLRHQLDSQLGQARVMDEERRALAARVNLLSLEPGIYVLTTGSDDDKRAADEDEYTIYHVMVSVGVEEFERDLQFGIARLGLFDWQFYFDYNGDGRVDTDMMRNFAKTIPIIGSTVSLSFDPALSQIAYDRFLESSGEAEYTSVNSIAGHGGTIAQQMWGYINSKSEDLAGWIRNTVEGQSAPELTQQEEPQDLLAE